MLRHLLIILLLSAIFPLSHPAWAVNRVDSLNQKIQQYSTQKNASALAQTYLALGEEYFRMFEHEKALQTLQAGLESARESKNILLQFRILDVTGRTYFWMDNYRSAIEYHWQANELADQSIPPKELADNLAHIGEIYIILGNFRQALDYELRSREINESINDSLGIAAAYDKIGKIYWRMKRYEGSLENFKKALSIYRGASQEIYIYQIQSAMAEVYRDMKRYDRAMQEAQSSLQKAESLGYQYGIAYSKGLIGSTLEAQDKDEEAEKYLLEAIEQFQLAGSRYELAEFATILARIRQKNGQKESALQLLDSALHIANDIQSLPLKTLVFLELSDVHKRLGNDRLAFTYLEAYTSRQDSLVDISNMNQTVHLETDYELRKRERQIEELEAESRFAQTRFIVLAISGSLVMVVMVLWLMYMRYRSQARTSDLLRTKNEEIQHQNEALSASNTELRRFSDLAAMDLRLPVDGIRKEMEKLEEEFPDLEGTTPQKQILRHLAQLDVLLAGISAFAIVKNDPSQWDEVELSEVVKEAIRALPENERKKATRIQMQNLPKVRGDKRQLIQLFQHLLSNAIRFRGEEDPEVQIGSEKKGKGFLISFKDNGKGIPASIQGQIFELFFQGPGEEEAEGSGVGLAVSRRIVQQHGGKIWVNSRVGEGSTFYFTLPA